MAKIFLNEGTEIEVKETSKEIIELTKQKKNEEKETGASDNLIKLTRLWYFGELKKNEQQIFLYMKRVLFFYD